MVRPLAWCALCALLASASASRAALIVNPALPITQQINVNLISVADDDGTDSTRGTFGSATAQAEVFSLVDVIYAQAGVNVEFGFRAGTYNSSFARTGTPGNNSPRPQGDLNTMRNNAASVGGVLSSDLNTINVFLVSIAPGFSQLAANFAAGLATINGNGVAYYGGSDLTTYTNGRESLASVLAHEIGHNLGLSHVTASQNLMTSGGGGQRLDATQIATIAASRFTATPLPTTPPGDFNNSGRVDGTDFLQWQRGGSPTPLGSGDYLNWRRGFGESPLGVATAHPVPEPDGAWLILAGMIVATAAARRCRALAPAAAG